MTKFTSRVMDADSRLSGLRPLNILLAGAASGALSRTVVQPLDVVKIRLQLQINSGKHPGAHYRCTSHALHRIIKEEGVRSLWKGHGTGQLQAASFSLLQFAVYEMTTDVLDRNFSLCGHVSHFICGSVAGAVAATASQPLDVLRTRFMAQGEPRAYQSVVKAGQIMLSQEGSAVFFRGLTPTLTQIVPQTGIQFALYTALKSYTGPGTIQTAMVGATAGLLSKLCVYPLEVCKRRLQVAGFRPGGWNGHVHVCRCLTDCIRTAIKLEGIRAFYKGLSPSLLKAGLSIGVRFTVYEEICRILTSLE